MFFLVTFKKKKFWSDVELHAFISAFWMQRQAKLFEFEARLVPGSSPNI